ncbi:MAG: SurA N-terminal domain-containing protein, partial [Bacteroidales bacterium]|nr:SurA N-terminal domain-containing protein [Bacteroidales bacterium]
MRYIRYAAVAFLAGISVLASAQRYPDGIIDKTIAVVGNEMITISNLEQEVQMMRASGMASDRNMRCDILEQMMVSKLFLMQARVDSLTVNEDMVAGEMNNRMDQIRTQLGGDEEVERYFGKPMYKLRQ